MACSPRRYCTICKTDVIGKSPSTRGDNFCGNTFSLRTALQRAAAHCVLAGCLDETLWHSYLEACAVQERRGIPVVGLSTQRRAFEYVAHGYNDERIHSLVCFACAQVKVDTGGCRSRIQYCPAKYLFDLPTSTLAANFSMQVFQEKYCKSGTPLAFRGPPEQDGSGPDFSDWLLRFSSTLRAKRPDLGDLESAGLLCCPEDQTCRHQCETRGEICEACQIPLCSTCVQSLERGEIIPQGLGNDNWIGYVAAWMYANQVTWMEKTAASPYWTGLTVFTVGTVGVGRKSRRRHLLTDALYSQKVRLAYKGQSFSAPMNWKQVQEQLEEIDRGEKKIVLPVVGEVLASRVCLCISAGLIDLNKCLKRNNAAVERRAAVDPHAPRRRTSGLPALGYARERGSCTQAVAERLHR